MKTEVDQELVKAWLSKTGHDRDWLAERCGVSKGTVNNWLSAGRPISGPSAQIIRKLMDGPPTLNPVLDLETFELFQAKAKSEGKTVQEKIAELIKAAVKGGIGLFILMATVASIILPDEDGFTARLRGRGRHEDLTIDAEIC